MLSTRGNLSVRVDIGDKKTLVILTQVRIPNYVLCPRLRRQWQEIAEQARNDVKKNPAVTENNRGDRKQPYNDDKKTSSF